MIDDMTVRNFAPNTMLCYLKQVTYFAQHVGRSPDRLGPEEIRSYQIYLAKERKVGISSRTVAVSALRFLCHVTLKQDRVIEMIPFPICCPALRSGASYAVAFRTRLPRTMRGW
jgi:integrase/recombinase XerD